MRSLANARFCLDCRHASLLSFDLLPLDRSGWLRAHVVDDAVDTADFIDDTIGDTSEHVMREVVPISCHPVAARHGAQCTHVLIRSIVAHDADAAHREEHGERLPDL